MAIEALLLACPADRWKTEQAIVFDWSDGPRQGIAALSFPACEFAFELAEERYNPSGLDDRLFRIRELPAGSVRSVLMTLVKLGEPSKPVWVPVWAFDSEGERREIDRAIDAVLARAGDTHLVVRSPDLEHFAGSWTLREIEPTHSDLFSALRIP
jgi:hypothetical protein